MTAQEYYEKNWEEAKKYTKFTTIKTRGDYTTAYFKYLNDFMWGNKLPPFLKQKMLPKP